MTDRRREIRGREAEWADFQMRRRNRVQGCGRAKKTGGVRKTDYKRYRKQGEQLYCPDWL